MSCDRNSRVEIFVAAPEKLQEGELDDFCFLLELRNGSGVGDEYNMRLVDDEEESFLVSLAFAHITFDDTEINKGGKCCFRAQGRRRGISFGYLLTSLLSMNIIIFAHTFVRATRYLHWESERCFSLQSNLCVRATEHHNIEC